MQVPSLIHQTWKNECIPGEYQAFVRTWHIHHPQWEHRLWTDAENRNFIATQFPEFLPCYGAYRQPIQRADAIRYFLLYHFGGMYVDLDVECLQPVSYTPYGCAIYLNADFTERTSASMEVLFSGYFFEHITGLSIVRRRFLHTALGVWISRDAKQDRSGYVGTYRYCSNSPVGSVDPYGMFTVNDAAISHCKEKVPFGSLQEVIACANALPAQQRFDLWYSLELSDLSWLIGLPDCPCYLWPMASPPTPQELNKAKQCAVITAEYQFASELYQGADPTVWSKPATIKFSVFHPNAKWEIRSIKPNASGASQQCTYDGKGRLITGGVSAGTPDRYQSYSATWGGWFAAGGGYVSNSGHYGHDVDPFNLARELDGGKPGENVDRYLEVRPPNAGKKSDGQPCDKNIVD